MTNELATTTSQSLMGRMAEKYGVDHVKLLEILRDTIFTVKKNEPPFSDTEIAAGLVLAERYDLDPFAREIYLTRSHGKILVIVPIDGWSKIVNKQKNYEGCEFEWLEDDKGKLKACTCTIHRSDRKYPTAIPEYLDECFAPKSDSNLDPWRKWPRRMLRHKAFIQAARIAFSLSGIIDPDEADRYVDVETVKSIKPRERPLTLPGPRTVTEGAGNVCTFNPNSQPGPATKTLSSLGGRVFSAKDQEVTPKAKEPVVAETADVPLSQAEAVESLDRPTAAEEVDAERAGLVKSFDELWRQHVDKGIDAFKVYGVTEDVSEIKTQDLTDLVAMMSDTISELAKPVESGRPG